MKKLALVATLTTVLALVTGITPAAAQDNGSNPPHPPLVQEQPAPMAPTSLQQDTTQLETVDKWLSDFCHAAGDGLYFDRTAGTCLQV